MSLLQIFIPEAGLGASCDWALRDAGSVKTGHSDYSTLPPANHIVLILAASRVLLTQVQLPAVGPGKLREMLAFAVEDKLLTEPDKVHTVAAPRAANGETAVAIIDKAWMRQQLAQLRQHGIRAAQMLAETLLPPLEDDSWSMVWHGQGGFVRVGPQAGFVVDGGDLHTPPMALMLALQEARIAHTAPQRLMLYHSADTAVPSWAAQLDIPIEQRGIWAWHSADSTGAVSLNLLQGEFAPARKAQAWIQHWRPALGLLVLIVIVHVLATLGDWARLQREQSRLKSAMVTSFKQAFPEASAIVDPALQMQRNLAQLQRARGLPDSADFLPLLAQAAPLLQAGQLQALQYEQDKLQIDLTLGDAAQLDTLRAQLRTLPLRTEISVPQTTPAGFHIRLSLGIGLQPQAK